MSSQQAHRQHSARGPAAQRRWRHLRLLVVALAGLSLWQLFTTGTINWPATVWQNIAGSLRDYATQPGSGWKEAAERLERLGSRKEGHRAASDDLQGRVEHIADGDTLTLRDGEGKQHIIRLYGIDTPEWDQAHGAAAKKALRKLVNARAVSVAVVDTDSFGRTVGTVYLGDTNINLLMVTRGHAWWFRRYAPDERQLQAAEQQARDGKLGLWAEDRPMPPWQWRREHRGHRRHH